MAVWKENYFEKLSESGIILADHLTNSHSQA